VGSNPASRAKNRLEINRPEVQALGGFSLPVLFRAARSSA
jgi:hypothetical protein